MACVSSGCMSPERRRLILLIPLELSVSNTGQLHGTMPVLLLVREIVIRNLIKSNKARSWTLNAHWNHFDPNYLTGGEERTEGNSIKFII